MSGAIGLYLVNDASSASATATSCCRSRSSSASGSTRSCRRSSARSRDRGGRPDAVPAVLHRAVHRRRRSSSPTSRRSLGVVLFIVANFAYQAALIYYDATLKTVSSTRDAGPAVRHRRRRSATAARSSSGCSIFLLDVPVEDRFRLDGRPLRGLRDPDLRVRPRAAAGRRAAADRGATSSTRSGSCGDRSRTPARCPGSAASCSAGSSTRDAVNTVIVVMSVVTVQGDRPDRGDRERCILLSLTVVAIAMSFVLGLARDRLGPEADAGRRCSSRGPSGCVIGGVAIGLGADRARRRSSSPARSSAAGSAASRSPTGC